MARKPTSKTPSEPQPTERKLFAVTGFRVVEQGLNTHREPIVEEVTPAQYAALAVGDPNWRTARESGTLRESMHAWWRRRLA